MGLDQYLYAKKYASPLFNENKLFDKLKEVAGSDAKFLDEQPSASIELKVAQWRKSNQVHEFFVNNCQHGEDDCRTSYVRRDQLEALISLCEQVIANKDLATDLLPHRDGFFFGSQEYGEWYFADLKDTIDMVKQVLLMDGEWDFYYSSSW